MAAISASAFVGSAKVFQTKAVARSGARPVVVSASRPMWHPGAVAPKHLDGTIPGDYGFDPLGLGANEDLLPWLKEAELMNGRWAMAAVPGILLTEKLGKVNWWEAGAEPTAFPTPTLIAAEVALFSILEFKRIQGWKKTGATGVLNSFPFDPMGMGGNKDMALKEVKNGRLAMLAFAGFVMQAGVQGAGPLACFEDHITNGSTVYQTELGPVFVLAIFSLNLWAVFNVAQKQFGDDKPDDFRAIPW